MFFAKSLKLIVILALEFLFETGMHSTDVTVDHLNQGSLEGKNLIEISENLLKEIKPRSKFAVWSFFHVIASCSLLFKVKSLVLKK